MKKHKTPALPPRKLILRREAIAQLTQAELRNAAGGDLDADCSMYQAGSCSHSNVADAACIAQQ
jgi:hypothetical protein